MLFWILLALLALFLGLGYYVMNLAVKGRRYTKEALAAQLDKPAYREIKETSLASIDWVASHAHEELHVMSYDGKLLHATYLPKAHAKGTILLFHGYRSCWQIDLASSSPTTTIRWAIRCCSSTSGRTDSPRGNTSPSACASAWTSSRGRPTWVRSSGRTRRSF